MTLSVLPREAHAAALECDRLIAVRCTGGSNAMLTYYKKNGLGAWIEQLSCNAFIGKAGKGKQREGDMKTPVGIFDLSMPFGILPAPSMDDSKGRKLQAYLRITENHYWCGQNGPYYNRLVDNAAPPEGYAPSKADEHMIDYRPSYHYGMVIGYNKDGKENLGSAIFLHCIGKNPYTAGCVAVDEAVMRELIFELSAGAKIVIF